MKIRKHIILMVGMTISLSALSNMTAQTMERQVIAAAGSNLSAGNYSLSYSMGETVTADFKNGNQLSQGFHQEWVVITAVDDPALVDFDINVFPNPTPGIVNVDSEESLYITVTDLQGRNILTKEVTAGKNELDISTFPGGIYLLVAQTPQAKQMKTFKIQKIE